MRKLHDNLNVLAPGDERRFTSFPELETLTRLSESCKWACSRTPKTWQTEYEDEVLQALDFPLKNEDPQDSPICKMQASLKKTRFIRNCLIVLVVFSALLNVLQTTGSQGLSSKIDPEFSRIPEPFQNKTSEYESIYSEVLTPNAQEQPCDSSSRDKKNAEIAQLKTAKTELESEVGNLTSKLGDLKMTFAQEQANSTIFRQVKEAEIKQLEDSKSKLEAEVGNLTWKYTDLQGKLAQEQARSTAVKQEYSKYREQTDIKIKDLEDDKRWHEERRRERHEHRHRGEGSWH